MDKKILITGTSSGLGRELFLKFKENGFETYGHQRNENPILKESTIFGDLNDVKTQEKIYNLIIEKNINVFINNAGLYLNKPLKFTDNTDIEIILKTNLHTPIVLTKKILDIFQKRKYGLLYNINSLAGIKGSKNETIYSASKHGLKGFTDSLKEELKEEKNIKIVNVILGAFKSKITKERKNYDDLGDPAEIADCIIEHIQKDYKTITNNDLIITRKH